MEIDTIETLPNVMFKENDKNVTNKSPVATELNKNNLESTEMFSTESCDRLQSKTVTPKNDLKTPNLAESTNNIEVDNNNLLQRSSVLSDHEAQTTNTTYSNELKEKPNLADDVAKPSETVLVKHRRSAILDSDSDIELDSCKQNSDTIETSKNTKINKRLTILDSDSETEESFNLKNVAKSKAVSDNDSDNELDTNVNHQENDIYNIESRNLRKKSRIQKRSTLADSDSETEEITPHNKGFNDARKDTETEYNAENKDGSKKSRIQKRSTLVDSDSDTEEITPHNKGFNDARKDTETESNAENKDGPKKSRIQKRSTLVDSDSDTEEITLHNKGFNDARKDTETESNAENKDGPKKSRIQKRSTLVDSDSDTEEIPPHNKSFNDIGKDTEIEAESENQDGLKKSRIQKRSTLVDSDSEMDEITPHNKSFNDDKEVRKNMEMERNPENTIQKSRLSLLCDSDSDEEVTDVQATSSVLSDDEIIEQSQFAENKNSRFSKSKNGRKAKKDNTDEIQKKMTAKDAAIQRKEIQSESQRMLREKNVSLPYHKPKAHNIKEFLARRSRLAVTSASGHTAPSVAIKMSTEQLEVISKKLIEREKEVKEFYKSESESDGDNDVADYKPDDANDSGTEKIATNSDLVDQENSSSADANKVATSENEGGNDKEKCDTESMETENDAMEVTDDVPNNIAPIPSEAEPMETNEIVQKESENLEKPCLTENIGESCPESTENYDFNLDDVNTEKLSIPNETFDDEQSPNKEKASESTDLETETPTTKSYDYDDLDREIENFGNSESLLPPVMSKFDLLKEKLSNIQPRLSGGPDEVIDLDSRSCEPKEVLELMKRFAKHVSAKKHVGKHKVSLSIVTVESGGDIHKETIAMNVEDDEDTEVQEEKPGAKLQRLRQGLQKEMDRKKAEMWQQKAAKGLRASEQPVDDGEEKTGYEDDILYDDEEEAEMTDEEDTEEEIEDDVELEDKPEKKSAFLDQEAEESEIEETESHKDDYEEDLPNENEDKNEDQNSKDCDDVDSEINAENDENSNISSEPPEIEPESSGKKKVLKRIIKPQEDSDEEDLFSELICQKLNYSEQLDSTVTADEEDIPPHQPRQLQTPIRAAISQTNSISKFLTPISFITSIQNLTSAKSIKNRPIVSPFRMPSDLSPNKEDRAVATQKKLFTDSQVLDSQGSLSIPTETQTQESLSDLVRDQDTVPLQDTEEEPPSTQDLMNICSGEFTGVTQLEPSEDGGGTQNLEFKSLGSDQDMVISQLIDEEELEVFKKKFESPVNPVTQRSISVEAQEIKGGGIIDSDDDDVDEIEVKQRKNQRKIQFSDDDSSDEEKEDSEGEIDLQDKDDVDEEDIDNIGYDSEENEVDLNDRGPQRKEKLKMTDFFEAEAELSESEWGSEDEDEKDLDKLEFELGDTEKFDEEQVKEDLERIHMRRMLDDDAREVKLLQEVYLEDGEMHGTGRQRQFKWKNIDSVDGDETTEGTENDGDDIYLDEEENEEHWRKKRHEREMFFKEKSQKSRSSEVDDESLLNESQLLKIGQKVLQRSTSSANGSQNGTPVEKINRPASPVIKSTLTLLSKRGSFLSRSDQVLQRVAEYTKLTTDISTNSSKTNKNFVFHSVSALEVSVAAAEVRKRKAEEGTPKVIKKLRLNTNLSPAVKKKTPLEKAKQLFNF